MGGYVNPFISVLVPRSWAALVQVFGRPAEYWLGGDSSQVRNIVVIWKEGVEDEERSPGRYSHALIQHSDIDGRPELGDVIFKDDGSSYTVVRIAAYAIDYSTIVLQAREEG